MSDLSRSFSSDLPVKCILLCQGYGITAEKNDVTVKGIVEYLFGHGVEAY